MKRVIRVLSVTIMGALLVLAAFTMPSPSRAERAERVLVQFRPGRKALVKQSLEHQGGQIHYEFDGLNTIAVTLPASALNGIRNNPHVVLVEQDAPRYPSDQTVPYGIDSVEARDVWDADRDGTVDPGAPSGSGRMVCIIDSGVHLAHEDLAGVNFAGGIPKKEWNTDNCGHGTHVAGTIAAMNNATGVVGVSPGTVSLYIVKVFGDDCQWTYSSTLVNAAQQCRDAGATIINMSLTGSYYSSFENNAFQDLYEEGILSIAAAGNGGGTAYGYPASYESVVSVAAVDQNNTVASFSRKNNQVEIAAPGVSVLSTFSNGGYVYMSGTSMATPHVAAAAAVVWSSAPTKTNEEVRIALRGSALDLGTAGRDNEYGYGLVRSKCACDALNPLPTSVELSRLEAYPDGASIRVEWETTTEVDNLGFNLYRAESSDGPGNRLNEGLILGQVPGSPLGAVYDFLDEWVWPGITYYYWLEDVDVYGRATLHGPVSATFPSMRGLILPGRPRPAPDAVVRPVPPGLSP
jgi:subtilisin family serine protease